MEIYSEQKSCRVCGSPITPVLDMGLLYPSAFLDPNDPLPPKAPLVLAECDNCGLLQLQHTVDLDLMYRRYWYQSGINPTMVAALQDVVECALERVDLKPGDVVVDIACNDKTLLAMYPSDVIRIGFDPALNLPSVTEIDCFVNDYFSASEYPLEQRAKIITSLAMFYDLPDPPAFVKDVAEILDDDGIWIMQISDLCSMLKTNSIDNPVHEHLEYYCADDILGLVEAAGLEVFRIEHNEVNSGSLRFYIAWAGQREIEPSVQQTRRREADYFASPEGSIKAFAKRVWDGRDTLVEWLVYRKNAGEKVYGLAASTKANILLQYFGIDDSLIVAIGDLNPDKFGKVMVGSNIMIVSEDHVLAAEPEYLLIFAWHFLDFFLKQMKPYLRRGGALVVPLPEPRVYRLDTFGELYSTKLVREGD